MRWRFGASSSASSNASPLEPCGRMRTGGMGEYILSGAVLLICSLVVFMQGLVDGAEWRARRFEWF